MKKKEIYPPNVLKKPTLCLVSPTERRKIKRPICILQEFSLPNYKGCVSAGVGNFSCSVCLSQKRFPLGKTFTLRSSTRM